jgi:hypothetical protein
MLLRRSSDVRVARDSLALNARWRIAVTGGLLLAAAGLVGGGCSGSRLGTASCLSGGGARAHAQRGGRAGLDAAGG